MTTWRRWMLGALTVAGMALAQPAQAGWQGVFQVTCNNRGQAPVTAAYYADPCNPCPCPQPQMVQTTRYVQRTYYQPVTCYQTRTYYEPVTTYRTSYYYEPVTTCRYVCSYDPCTCSYRMVPQQTTCYRLRSQCCPVQSMVARCCQVPVTTYQKACYWEAQTCYSLVDPCTNQTIQTGAAAPAHANPVVGAAPGVSEATSPYNPTVPGVSETRTGGTSSPGFDQQYQNQPPAVANPNAGSSFKRPLPPAPPAPPVAPAAPAPRGDRIAGADWRPATTLTGGR